MTATMVADRLDAHMIQCRLDKEAIRDQLSEQDHDRKSMHAENQQRFGRLERVVYIAMGVGTAIAFLGSHIDLGKLFH